MVKRIAFGHRSKEGPRYVLVDDADYKRLSQFNWYFNGRYVYKLPAPRTSYTPQYLHRLVADASPEEEVDHLNGDKLDNRRCNLRLCTRLENSRNRGGNSGSSSIYKGVTWHKKNRKWQAAIVLRVNGKTKRTYIGTFWTEEEAAKAYDARAKAEFGEFARLNFPS